VLWKSRHLYYPEEEDDHGSEDPTGDRPQGTEESEEGTAVNPKLFDFMLKELVPERYLNPEQAMSGQKMEPSLGRIGKKVEAKKMVDFFLFISSGEVSSSRAVRRG